MTKKEIILKGTIELLTFEEVYEKFFSSIQHEAWKMKSKYGSALNVNEAVQQFTIELWKAYEKYDAKLGYYFSTFAYHRFNKARRDLLQENFLSKEAEWNANNISIDKKFGDDEQAKSFSNREFLEDDQYYYHKRRQPDIHFDEKELFERICSILNSIEERELVIVLLDRKSYSVNDYAEKYSISRQAANKRLLAVKKKIKEYLGHDLGGHI